MRNLSADAVDRAAQSTSLADAPVDCIRFSLPAVWHRLFDLRRQESGGLTPAGLDQRQG